jgi:hypothetical protein
MGSINDASDGHAVATTCYSAALVYLVLFAFSGYQACLFLLTDRFAVAYARIHVS